MKTAAQRGDRLDSSRVIHSTLAPVLGALAVGVCASLLVGTNAPWWKHAVADWDAAAGGLVLVQWSRILGADAETTRRRAAREDPGRVLAWVIVFSASLFSLLSSAVVLRRAEDSVGPEKSLWFALTLLSVVLAWVVTHTEYTLRYARLYYDGGARGLIFPGNEPPADLDFAYFAFTLGMCFQVSDVAITSAAIRRATLAHALVSYAYNTIVVALALGVISGRL